MSREIALDLSYKYLSGWGTIRTENKNNLETYPVHTSVLYTSLQDFVEKFSLNSKKCFEVA